MERHIFGEKLKGEQYLDRSAAYAIIVNKQNNKIAVIKNPRNYFLPGGGTEEDESSQECIIRECLEEMGFYIKIKEFLCKGELYHNGLALKRYLHSIADFYIVESFEKVKEPIEKDHEILWMSVDEAIENLWLDHQIWAVKEFNRKIIR